MSFDYKCYELAEYFLDGHPKDTEENRKMLAQVIQDEIEAMFPEEDEYHIHTCQQCDKVVVAGCDCDKPDSATWCSSNCRAAFDL